MSKENGEDTMIEHNSKARAAIIQSVCREIEALEDERASINDSIRELKSKKIKGDLGMKIADFNAAYRLYKLEDEKRDQYLDTLKECFDALGAGDQLNFLPAMEADAPENPVAA